MSLFVESFQVTTNWRPLEAATVQPKIGISTVPSEKRNEEPCLMKPRQYLPVVSWFSGNRGRALARSLRQCCTNRNAKRYPYYPFPVKIRLMQHYWRERSSRKVRVERTGVV
ncbi:hypothetical protein OUZ56_019269 [Daphnia magna]|uniref:Uncharacterized protein n=1 Tax=Daphnia magna TaxID=35525 RepID=A0ABQ9ZB49_9CRUS|nr:hypothetical protein OUZ56_019269 [Daphnia magna]